MFSNRQGAFHWSSSYPGFMLEFNTEINLKGKKDIYRLKEETSFVKSLCEVVTFQ